MQYEDLENVRIPTVILAGERDIVKEKHTKAINRNIPNSTFEIINNESHGSYVIHSNKLYNIIKEYI